MPRSRVASLITRYARKYGVDPAAALAVARVEGGLRTGAVGDAGTSYGPFQLHVGGALPRGRGAGWANSEAGIDYALREIGKVARGLHGRAAVENIVRRFERPANPTAEIARAMGGYGAMPDFGPPSSFGTPMGAPALDRRALAFKLINTPFSKPLDPLTLLGSLPSSSPAAPVAPASSYEPTGSRTKGTGKWGVTPELVDFAGHFGLTITSGYRSIAKQRGIYAHRSAPGSVAAPGHSYHNFGKAIDVAVNEQSRAAYQFALKHPQLFAEAFFDPAGVYIKNGRIVRGRIGGHSDHIHFALR